MSGGIEAMTGNRPQPNKARSRRTSQTRRRSSGIWLGLIGSICLVTGGIVLVTNANDPDSHTQTASVDPRGTGTIVIQKEHSRCGISKFDNYSGRTIDDVVHCANSDTAADGSSAPIGTIHRLDAISKSFFGKTQ